MKTRSRPAQRQILLDHGVRTISVSSTANLSADETAAALLAATPAIADEIRHRFAPYILLVGKAGAVRHLTLR